MNPHQWFDTMQVLTLNNHERLDTLTTASEVAAKTTTLTVNTTKTSSPTSTPAALAKKHATLVKGRPLKSDLGGGHPASILSNTRKKVYFGNEDC